MGSFSYTCQLSGLPITAGDRCAILPLLPKEHWGYDCSQKKLSEYGKGSLVSNDGPNMFFDEFCFPIFGTYNDYGRLENIEEDDNTKVLEKFFDMKINDITDCILDGRKDEWKDKKHKFSDCNGKVKPKKNPNHLLLLKASATWLRGDVYDSLSKKPSKGYFDRLDLGTHGLLLKLGFTPLDETMENDKNRYYKPYKKGKVTVYSDGNWISDKKGDRNNFNVYDLQQFKEWCAKKGETLDISSIEHLSKMAQTYDCILPYIDKINRHTMSRWSEERVVRMLLGNEYDYADDGDSLEQLTEILKNIQKRKKENPEEFKKTDVFDSEQFMKERIAEAKKKPYQYLPKIYFETIKQETPGFLRKNIVDWFKVKSYYYPVGRFLYPIGTSPQDGGHEEVLELLTVSKECLEAEIEERRKLGYYDE